MNFLMFKIMLLFFVIVLCEIVGCYLLWLWFKCGVMLLLLIFIVLVLVLFVWFLMFYLVVSGWVYVVYGGVYVCIVLFWLWVVDGVKLIYYDWVGVVIVLCGMLIIVVGWGWV